MVGRRASVTIHRPTALVDWLFRDRRTGRITIAQFPNVALGVFLAASLLQWLLDPEGWPQSALAFVASGALIWWAVDEVLRGVNPWRRLLGGTVLVAQILRLVG